MKRIRAELLVTKWGNSLAVRLPADMARQIGVSEGDSVLAEVAAEGRLVLAPLKQAIGKAQARRMREFLARQNQTVPVVADMRRADRL